MQTIDMVRKILGVCLQLGDGAASLDASTQLLGGMPEFNSLAITAIIAAIEDELDCEIDDGELTAEIFETVGSLVDFVDATIETL